MYKDVAEKYGYIIAGSNNSRNFDARAQQSGAQAMLEDALRRFSIDDRRIYTAGFSGGARVATMVALRCSCKISGVIAMGATYPSHASPSAQDSFLYFMTLGDTDFNYPEVVQLQAAKEHLGSAYRLRLFPGTHQWAPPELFAEAMEWFQLRAMMAGTVAKDDSFIRQQAQARLHQAQDAKRVHDVPQEYLSAKSLRDDFQGQADVVEALKAPPDLKQALERERKEVNAQAALMSDASAKVAQWSEDVLTLDARARLKGSIVATMARLKHEGKSARDEVQRRVHQRAFNALFAQIVEAGQERQATKRYSEALPFYELLTEAAPERAWPSLLMAETRVAQGDRKRALQAIRRAAGTGRVEASDLTKDEDLAPLFSDPEFRKIVDDLRTTARLHPK